MRTFKEFPKDNICPVCKTNDNKECVLIAVDGTNDDGGRTYEALPVHLGCIELTYYKGVHAMYQIFGK